MVEHYTSQGGTVGSWSTNAPDDFDFSGDDEGNYPVSDMAARHDHG
jgi:hypothetical protein